MNSIHTYTVYYTVTQSKVTKICFIIVYIKTCLIIANFNLMLFQIICVNMKHKHHF